MSWLWVIICLCTLTQWQTVFVATFEFVTWSFSQVAASVCLVTKVLCNILPRYWIFMYVYICSIIYLYCYYIFFVSELTDGIPRFHSKLTDDKWNGGFYMIMHNTISCVWRKTTYHTFIKFMYVDNCTVLNVI